MASYRVTLALEAAEALAGLPRKTQRQLVSKLSGLAPTPRSPDSVLHGHENLHRVRSGDFRIVYQIDDADATILVLRIGDRRDVYRALER